MPPSSLPFRLWVLRHGESRANKDGIIVSQPGPRAFVWADLTEAGLRQAEETAMRHPMDPSTLILTSDFARAASTARIAAATWSTAEPEVAVLLRERDFGSFEGLSSEHYDQVWEADEGRGELAAGVETVTHVVERTRSLLDGLVARFAAQGAGRDEAASDVVLVAHGDVLQILQAWLGGLDPAHHRRLPHLGNAELRRLR